MFSHVEQNIQTNLKRELWKHGTFIISKPSNRPFLGLMIYVGRLIQAILLCVSCEAQKFQPGRSSPIFLETLNATQIQDVLETLSEDDSNWYFVPILEESDTDLSRYPPDVKKRLKKFGSYIYGPSTIYSNHCPGYGNLENATQIQHEGMKDMLDSRFGWLLEIVRKRLADEVGHALDEDWLF